MVHRSEVPDRTIFTGKQKAYETRNMAEQDIMSFVVGIKTAGMNEKSSKMTENVIFNGLLEPNSIMVVYLILMEGTGVPGENH